MTKRFMDKGLEEAEKQLGRMIRNLSMPGMSVFQASRGWCPAIDVYETETEVLVYVDTAGIDSKNLAVVADNTSVTISGSRQRPVKEQVSRVHQLEIEHGHFHRSVRLPVAVDVSRTVSAYKDGILEIRMPKEHRRGRIEIKAE